MSAKPPVGEGSFLDRWSRRKRAAAAGVETREAEASPSDAPQAGPEPEPVAQEAPPEPEEFVEPPALETIGPDFDMAHWLRQKVPEAWKRQALRHAWSSDPAIRDFKGLADYDLDYNTPGMAPGYGPLTESDDVAAMARKIFGDPEPEDVAAARDAQPQAGAASAPDPSHATDDTHAASQRERDRADPASLSHPQDKPISGPTTADNAPEAHENRAASQQSGPDLRENPQTFVRNRRRNGGAIPT